MENEHPIVRKARLKAERARIKAEKARDEFFKVLMICGTILIFTTTAALSLLAYLNQ